MKTPKGCFLGDLEFEDHVTTLERFTVETGCPGFCVYAAKDGQYPLMVWHIAG